jgi:putative thioredoxin
MNRFEVDEMTAGQALLDVTDATFATDVLEQSKTKTVVVDFWAAWCGPCRVLGPTIERVAEDFGDDVVLKKLNVDENPAFSSQFRVTGLPTVKAFRNGQVVNEFTGALPEPHVRAFFQSLAPTAAEKSAKAAAELLERGDTAGAEQLYRAALEQTPDNPDAVVGLATLLAQRGETAEAEGLLKRVPADRRAKVLKHRIFLESYAARHAGENIEMEATNNPRDPRARYRWGLMLAAREDYRAAMDELIESVRWDKHWEDGAARKSILAIFDILGLDDPMTREYQRKLENVLF